MDTLEEGLLSPAMNQLGDALQHNPTPHQPSPSKTTQQLLSFIDESPDAFSRSPSKPCGPNSRHSVEALQNHGSQEDDERTIQRASNNPFVNAPSLKPSKTAPTMPTAMVEEASSQLRLHRSFAGFDMGGDTQPMDSQIYKQYTSTRASGVDEDWDVSQPTGQDVTLHTGDAGYVDLVSEWENQRADQDAEDSMPEDDIDELSPSTQDRVRSATSPKFRKPETPTRSSKKRDRRGEIISSVTRTPGSALTAAFFGNANGAGATAMSLSQAFNATQAPSSPLANVPTSDPVFQRPSPNFFAVTRSSPPAAQSSPTKAVRSELSRSATEPVFLSSPVKMTSVLRSTTEPRDTYMTMKESQERREVQRRREEEELLRLRSEEEEDDDFDDEPTAAEKAAIRRRARDAMLKKSSIEFSKLSAPSRTKQDMRRKVLVSSDGAYITPVRSSKKRKEVIQISPDAPDEEQLSDDGSLDELTSSPKTVGKLAHCANQGLQVPTTSSRRGQDLPDTQSQPVRGSSETRDDALDLHVSRAASQHALADGSPSGSRSESRFQPRTNAAAGPQTVAVADSQPDNAEQPQSLAPPPPLPSSNDPDGRILQSQLASLSGTARAEVNAALLNGVDSSSLPRPPPDSSQSVRGTAEERMPSSPPLLPAVTEDAEDQDVEMSDEEVDLVANYAGRPRHEQKEVDTNLEDAKAGELPSKPYQKIQVERVYQTNNAAVQSVPETDPPEELDSPAPDVSTATSKNATAASSVAVGSEHLLPPTFNSNGTTAFETARTHLSASPARGRSTGTSQETPKSQRIRRFAEISLDPTPEEAMEVDLEIGLVTEEDREFEAIMSGSSPVRHGRKRRKVYSAKALRSPARARQLPSPAPALHEQEAGKELPEAHQSPSTTQKRETEGAAAAARAREAAVFHKPAVLKPGKLSRPVSKASKQQNIVSKAATGVLVRVNRAVGARTEIAETPLSRSNATSTSTTEAAPGPMQETTLRQSVEVAPLQTAAAADPQDGVSPPDEAVIPDAGARDFPFPNRVLALFKGGNMAFYPATCLGRDGPRYKVRFDDGTVDNLDSQHLKSLELREDDLVKVDLPNMRQKTYTVCAFKDRIAALLKGQEYPLTDSRGHQTVVLAIKARASLPNAAPAAASDTVEVPLTSIYLTSSMWTRIKDRKYEHAKSIPLPARLQTPTTEPSAPGTPTSRTRRQPAGLSRSILRASSTTSSAANTSDGLFSGMAFAVTFSAPGDEKDETIRLIQAHGGRLLEPGFETLFEMDDGALDTPAKPTIKPSPAAAKTQTPSKAAGGTEHATATAATDTAPALRLAPEAENLGFVALIADRHSRRAKYMQALALGLPCLHPRYIADSVSAATVLPFARYLLPAGESAFLGGAVHSRVLAPYEPRSAVFKEVVERREKLLEGRSVLLVVGKGRREDRRRAYGFLTMAMGAGRVGRVRDLEGARRALGMGGEGQEGRGRWDWVYVDAVETETERVLFGAKGQGGQQAVAGRKRKRGRLQQLDGEEEGVGGGDAQRDRRARVVSDEFVIQSLILGSLVEE